jgi:hypothetical protein
MKHGLTLLAVTLSLGTAVAQAHDTWFEPLDGAHELALGTGTVYPLRETGIDATYLRQQGCSTEHGMAALEVQRNTDDALVVATPPGALACWAQLAPFEIELPPDKIDLYLKEVRPPQAIADAWDALKARGLGWHERYVKHSRIELHPSVAPRPSTMDFDMLLASFGPQVGQPLQIQVLRDGAPLAGFAVELRSERSRAGFWRRTDGEGRISFAPPLPGYWIARGVDLRQSSERPDTFDSRFITLAFEVKARTAAP